MTEPEDRGKNYSGSGVSVFYDPKRCIHFGACVRGLPNVFQPGERPWIRPDQAPPGQIAEIVRRCPTGALHYELFDETAEHPDAPTTVAPQADGPLFLRGDVVVDLGDRTVRDTRVALCRCGGSSNKPFCDGTHKTNSWRADGAASSS